MYVFLYLLVQIVVKNRPEIKNLQVLAISFSDVRIGQILGFIKARKAWGGDTLPTPPHDNQILQQAEWIIIE